MSNPWNIIQVSGGGLRIPVEKGGASEMYILSSSKYISEEGHNVTILDRKYSPTDPDVEYIDGVKTVRLGARRINLDILRNIPGFSKISNAKLNNETEIFVQEEGKGIKKFIPFKSIHTPEETSKKYPFLMSIDYNLDYYRNLALTQESKGLRVIRDSRWIKISPEDARRLKLNDGETVVIDSVSGKAQGLVKISETMPKGVVGSNFLWNGDSNFSLVPHAFPASSKNHLVNLIPVKIKRGK